MPANGTLVNSIIQITGQINPMLSTAIGILQTIRAIRDAAAHAGATLPDGTLPTDEELIHTLLNEAGLLKIEAHDLRAWLKTLPQ